MTNIGRILCLVLVVLCTLAYNLVLADTKIEEVTVEPTNATSNSIWKFSFLWTDTDGLFPMPNSLSIQIESDPPLPALVLWDEWQNLLGKPCVYNDGRSPKDGRRYTFRATAGLKFPTMPYYPADPEDPNQPEPGNPASRRLHTYDESLIYWDQLVANDDGSARTVKFIIRAMVEVPPDEEGGTPEIKTVEGKSEAVTIHDSHLVTNEEFPTNLYGGISCDRDLCTAYEKYPDDITKDPLSTLPPGFQDNPEDPNDQFMNPEDPFNPDDGTSSTTFNFRVMYVNTDNLPPQQYIPDVMFSNSVNSLPWTREYPLLGPRRWYNIKDRNYWTGEKLKSGVVLYFAPVDSDEYIILPMEKENPEDNTYSDGVMYKFTFAPDAWNGYRNLPNGKYKYFFATTDDIIRTYYGKVPSWIESYPFSLGDMTEMGYNYSYSSSWSRAQLYNLSNFVDRPSFPPGVNDSYPYRADEHPIVSLGLDGPADSYYCVYGTRMTDAGNMGTVRPVRSMISPVGGSSTVGATSETELYFQIEYSQLEGIAPEAGGGGEISVWIDPGTANERRYTLARTRVLGDDVQVGVMYRTSTPVRLAPGQHSYRFTASDGQRRVIWPVSGTNITTRQLYINNKLTLSNGGVEPRLGTAGDNFRYTVTYTDADNQPPYCAYLWVKYGDDPDEVERVTMRKLDPTDRDFTNGCVYIFDSANLAHKLEPGARKFYFEFMDNWGWRDDPNSRLPGEQVFWPGQYSWVDGPFITENHRPVLTNGIVMAEDGTSNPATLWSYKVRYTDYDNHRPAYMNLYIGKAEKDADGKIVDIVWNYGYPMNEANPSDVLYNDGKDYVYSTRLPSVAPGDTFYYAFAASDGIDVAVYHPTVSPSANAIWDPMERIQPEQGSENKIFKTTYKPIAGEIPSFPVNKIYRYPIVYNSSGTELVYGGKQPDYTVDFVNGVITLKESSDYIDVKYWFGTLGPVVSRSNTPPTLESGRVSPNPGASSDTFVFSVVYKDPDGPWGQAPSFVRVKIDGQDYTMRPVAGTADYRAGVRYEVSTTLALGAHSHFFEASDGVAYAVFDLNGSRSSNKVIVDHLPIPGPYVNDLPTLTNGTVYPRGTVPIYQIISYSVTYTDTSNEPPDTGYPLVFIDNPTEADWGGTVTSTSTSGGYVITDNTKNWQVNQFKGMPLQMISGPTAGDVYRIINNTATSITVYAVAGQRFDLIASGNQFKIGRLLMIKADPSDSDYTDGVIYQAQVPSLGVGTHTAHFRSVTTETIGPQGLTRVTSLREPLTGEIEGPTVVDIAPPGNRSPVLSAGGVSPTSGRSSDTFTFIVTYADPDGDPPNFHDGVLGYCRLVIDGGTAAQVIYDMNPPSIPNYTTGAVMSYAVTGLTPGVHKYHFEASDGYFVARFPVVASQFLTININRKPVLSDPQVIPARGNEGRPYTYRVKYTDADNNAPASIKLWIDDPNPSQAIEIKDYAIQPPGSLYSNGVIYEYILPSGRLSSGTSHNFYFTANDGLEDAVPTPKTDGPVVYANVSPTLSQGAVTPSSGWSTDTYTYSVVYSDPNGDEPQYVKVYIDGSDETKAREMTKRPQDTNFETGVTYTFEQQGLTPGAHTFFFLASDWMTTAREPSSGSRTGPVVSQRPTATITIRCSDSPRVGESVTISGAITPAMLVQLTITITRPSGSTSQHTVNCRADGTYSYSFVPNAGGVWKFRASWAGGGNYLPTNSPELTVAIGGPTITISGLNMISLPINPSSSFPDGVFGRTPPFALAKWIPARADYSMYSLLPGIRTDYNFPAIAVGQGYWIKTLEPKTIAPNGSMISTTAPFSIPLSVGWNQIGNPFFTDISWANLRVRYNNQTVSLATAHVNQWVREYGWFYDSTARTYKLVDATRDDPSGGAADRYMRPWLGYWVKALVPCELLVSANGGSPPPPPFLVSKEKTAVASDAVSLGWRVRVTASNGDLKSSAVFGIGNDKTESPMCLENFVHVYFADSQGTAYAEDLRPSISVGDQWELRVVTDTPGYIDLAWEAIGTLPKNIRLVLIDEEGRSQDMSPGSCYRFEAPFGLSSRSFRIVPILK